MQVGAGARFVKRCVSCLLCSRNQRGNTESISLWRQGTAVVHRRGIESGKAGPPPPPPLPPLRPPPPAAVLSWRAESRRRLRAAGKNMRPKRGFHIPSPALRRARTSLALSQYSHGSAEDAERLPGAHIRATKPPKRVPGVERVHPRSAERQRSPGFCPGRWRGGVICSRALRRRYCCCENVKSERDPRLPPAPLGGKGKKKKTPCLLHGASCFISIRPPSVSLNSAPTSPQCPGLYSDPLLQQFARLNVFCRASSDRSAARVCGTVRGARCKMLKKKGVSDARGHSFRKV